MGRMPILFKAVLGLLLLLVIAACNPLQLLLPQPDISDPTPNPLSLSANVNDSTSGTISFQNDGNEPLDFSVSDDQSWLSITPTSGSLAAGNVQALLAPTTPMKPTRP